MRVVIKFSYFIGVLLIAFSGMIFGQSGDRTLEERIREIERSWLIESYKTGDMSAYDKHVAAEFLITHSNGKILNKAEKRADIIKNRITGSKPADIFRIEPSTVRVTISGNSAVTKGYIIENYLWKGERYLDHVHFTNSYIKRGNRWLALASHLSRKNQKQGFAAAIREVAFRADDGTLLFSDLFLSDSGKHAPVIMLFHQGGGDARGEYRNIMPRLAKLGYNLIAVDLRKGGNRFGSDNRTVTALGNRQTSYCEAYSDLKATLGYLRDEGFIGKRIAWGSSFSAALVTRLAAEYPDVLSGALAFSPASGGPMKGCRPGEYLSAVKIPLLALRPASEMQRESVKAQLALFEKSGHRTFVARNGVHGSSMLDESRVEGGVEENWKEVIAFLRETLEN